MDKQDKELMKVLKGMSEEDRELTLKLIENLLELDEDARIRTFRYALYLKNTWSFLCSCGSGKEYKRCCGSEKWKCVSERASIRMIFEK